jgi:hypothetical protein
VRLHIDHSTWHDFLATNAAVHHARNAKQAMASVVATGRKASSGSLAALLYLLRHIGLETFRIKRVTDMQKAIPVADLATETFWSRAPFAFGVDMSGVVKFRLTHSAAPPERTTAEPDLGGKFAATLREQGVAWDFEAQFFVDAEKTPIERGDADWDPHAAWQKVAILTIPAQQLDDEVKYQVDAFRFNPWNVGDDGIRPLGALNRIRRPLYHVGQEQRRRPAAP